MKALIGVYGVYDLVEMWQRYQLQSPRENNIENFMGASPMDDPKLYFEASSINYATFANNHIGVLLSVGTEDDLVDRRAHTDAFLLRLKQANFFVRTCIVQGAPHYWLSDPIDEPGKLFRLHGAASHPLPEGAAVVAIRAFSGKVNLRFSVENATTQRNLAERVSAHDRSHARSPRAPIHARPQSRTPARQYPRRRCARRRTIEHHPEELVADLICGTGSFYTHGRGRRCIRRTIPIAAKTHVVERA